MSSDPLQNTPDPLWLSPAVDLPPLEHAPGAGGLLDAILTEPEAGRRRESSLWNRFLAAPPAEALELWCSAAGRRRDSLSRQQVARWLGRDIARLDALLSRQVDAILHHPRFQQIEASWHGLRMLVEQTDEARQSAEQDGEEPDIKIRVLNVSKRELFKDVDRAVEFDQSQIFKKVYEDEFGTAGGTPYGVLIGDYQFTNRLEDIELLSKMAEVAAASFAPFVAAATPELLGLDDFRTLEQPVNIAATFEQLDYLKWRAFRDREEARFVGLTLPRVLMRLPYDDDTVRPDGFRYREAVAGPDRSRYLWGSAAYAFGQVLVRAFAASGWFAEIRGVERGVLGGGLVTGLPVHSFSTDRRGVAPKTSTEVSVSEPQERALCAQGLIPLCHAKDTEFSVFYSNQSAHKPQKYDDDAATANAKISAMLQYVVCASRFAHYLKLLARNKVGSMVGEQELRRELSRWIHQYVAADERASAETKAKYPLRAAEVEVREVPGHPGNYQLVMNLFPHFQLDELTGTLRLVTRLAPISPG